MDVQIFHVSQVTVISVHWSQISGSRLLFHVFSQKYAFVNNSLQLHSESSKLHVNSENVIVTSIHVQFEQLRWGLYIKLRDNLPKILLDKSDSSIQLFDISKYLIFLLKLLDILIVLIQSILLFDKYNHFNEKVAKSEIS